MRVKILRNLGSEYAAELRHKCAENTVVDLDAEDAELLVTRRVAEPTDEPLSKMKQVKAIPVAPTLARATDTKTIAEAKSDMK